MQSGAQITVRISFPAFAPFSPMMVVDSGGHPAPFRVPPVMLACEEWACNLQRLHEISQSPSLDRVRAAHLSEMTWLRLISLSQADPQECLVCAFRIYSTAQLAALSCRRIDSTILFRPIRAKIYLITFIVVNHIFAPNRPIAKAGEPPIIGRLFRTSWERSPSRWHPHFSKTSVFGTRRS